MNFIKVPIKSDEKFTVGSYPCDIGISGEHRNKRITLTISVQKGMLFTITDRIVLSARVAWFAVRFLFYGV